MPTYQYRCTNPDCGNEFELVQTFTEPAASQCPVCGQSVRKVYGSVGVVFKGSGFYRNDSRSDGKGGKDSASGAAKDGGSKDSAGKDSSTSKDATSSKDSGGSSAAKESSTSSSSSSSSSNGSANGTPAKSSTSTPAAASK